jgi:hypothetical protein
MPYVPRQLRPERATVGSAGDAAGTDVDDHLTRALLEMLEGAVTEGADPGSLIDHLDMTDMAEAGVARSPGPARVAAPAHSRFAAR